MKTTTTKFCLFPKVCIGHGHIEISLATNFLIHSGNVLHILYQSSISINPITFFDQCCNLIYFSEQSVYLKDSKYNYSLNVINMILLIAYFLEMKGNSCVLIVFIYLENENASYPFPEYYST